MRPLLPTGSARCGPSGHPPSRLWHPRGMTNQSGRADSLKPSLYAVLGTVLLAIGGMLFVNLDEDPEIFMVFTVAFAAPGLYLLVAGAVARGILVSRH